MGNILFTSDTHFNHANIIKYCNRPYSSVEEMNQGLEEEWNKVVSTKDTIWHLGDVTWNHFDLNRLNGQKKLIKGNHDHETQISGFFKEVYPYYELKGMLPKNRAIAMFHYPIESWNGKFHGALHFHGHAHGTTDNTGLLRFDMGVDCWDMKPVPIESVLSLVPQRKEEAESIKTKPLGNGRDERFKELNRKADYDWLVKQLKEVNEEVITLQVKGMVGGCTCMTKTPEVNYHNPSCKYRISSELGDKIGLTLSSIITELS